MVERAASPLRVHLLGGLRVEAGQTPIPTPGGRARSLLAFLLLHPDTGHPRERLADVLWPDDEPGRATRHLIDAAYRLRQAMPAGSIVANRATLRLERTRAWVDVWAFDELLQRGTPADLRDAVELYGGELLPEIYEDWIAPRRAALADAYRTALGALAEEAESAGRQVEAFGYYHRLTAADPLDEVAHRGLMRAYLRAGHAAAAIQQFERLTALLRAELGIDPSPESRAIVEAARRQVDDAEAIPARPFVGRRRDRAAALERIDRAAGGSLELVLVEGEPGIGKSRLLDVLMDDARWRGFHVAAARAVEAATSPYAPLDAAVGSALTTAMFDRLRPKLSPAATDAVAGLLPHLIDRAPFRDGERGTERPNLALGLAALFRELTAARPWLLVLDDVHFAGPAFWDALRFLEEAGDLPLAVLLAARPRELRERPHSWDAARALDRHLVPLRLQLSGLALDESRALADAMAGRVEDRELADLQRITEGNPLHLQQAFATTERIPGRQGFVELLDHRLATLPPEARAALEAAAVLGPGFSLAEWLALVPKLPAAAIDEVVAARLVVELSDGYALEHDLTRQHVYESIPTELRRELHRRAAAALPRERTSAATLALHNERGGQTREAVAGHHRAAEEAFSRYAYPEALTHAERALQLGADSAERGALLSLRHRILGLLLRVDEWRGALDEAERHASETGDGLALIWALEGRLSLHTLDGDFEAMEVTGQRALDLSAELRDEAAEARVLGTLGWHVSESLGDNRRALPMLRRAARLAAGSGDEPTRVATLCMLSSALRSVGRCKAAHVSASRAMTLVSTRPALYRGRAHALAELAETALELGRFGDARDSMRAALEGYRELDDPWSYGSALFGLINICSSMGQPPEAIAAGEALVALSGRLGLAAASDYGVWHRVGLGRARLSAGDVSGAEHAIDEVRDVVPGATRPRIALAGLIGQLALARGDAALSLPSLELAFDLWLGRSEPRDVAIAFWTSIAAARAQRRALAGTALAAGLRALSRTDMERHDVLAQLARFEVEGHPAALRSARAAITRQAARFTEADLRTSFERDVPLHDHVRHLENQLAGTSPGVLRLVRADVPLGRAIRDDEWVEIPWLAEPDPDRDGPASAAERRQRRLVLLLERARAAGALPTDELLAEALGVSRRTILRDMKALRVHQQPIGTRRRRS
ncbi:MAG TPA: BTAD domain-containing putative transcriptional regulator [Candidatus Limnocylindria bacterium]|nr:BTAD domain-containing putative transcriptional regulator [Candidatus Limnocylindria bacterium]